MDKFLIIDGNSIINRAFYGVRLLTNKHGVYTNGIYGFLNILFKTLDEINPKYVAVAFDLKAPTFRHKMYDGYKAQRKPMPDELRMQMPILKEILMAMNIKIYEKEGYEADDIIGTVGNICSKNNTECLILTGDKDDLQLASKTTKIHLIITKGQNTETTVYDDEKVFERYGVSPLQFIDVKGLMGDASDNIPGVKGIGEKTATSLIAQYGSIEGVYEHIDEIKGATNKKLTDDKDMAYLSKELATINTEVPIDINFDDALLKEYNNKELEKLFVNLEFNTFLKRLNIETEKEEIKLDIIKQSDAKIDITDKFIYKIYQNEGEIYALSYKAKNSINYIICDMFLSGNIYEELKKVFEDENILKISSDIKNDIVFLNKFGIDYSDNYFDTSVAGYVLNPSRNGYEINKLAHEFLDMEIDDINSHLGSGKSKKQISAIEEETLKNIISADVYAIEKLYEYEKNEIKKLNQSFLLYDIELPLIKVLSSMEIEGIKVDKEKLIEYGKLLSDKIENLEKSIYELSGEEFNISSPKQLGVILFEKLNLPVVKKTKTGYSTDIDVLEKLKGYHEVIENIIEYRSVTKLKSTYADGLLAVINPSDNKIHSSFNQTVTVTGRISSTEPNLQNIPIRHELGREFRKMFVASCDDCVLVDADYSQIELRILAHIADDKMMIDAFKEGEDIHTSTASNLFGISKDEMTPLYRSRAKAVNFGIVYGKGAFSLAQDLSISQKEAKSYIDGYFEKYSNIKKYMTDIVEYGKNEGYVETLFGRRRYLPELKASNFIQRSAGERMAFNTPIQGSAADIIKIAMVKVYRALKENNLKSKLILQVHDELIIEAKKDEVEKVKELLVKCMESAADLSVPLTVDANVGSTWYEAH
ncbi:MAG: DNA polymerase I [Ruminococcaceae bacterium]|nr:DNA polymerase I [Oscillospiraceae bacterium]